MSDLNDLSRPVTTDTEPNVLDTLRAHIIRAATWSGWGATGNKVAGIMSAVTAAVSGGRSLRLYRRNDANTSDEEIVSLPGVSIGGNAATATTAGSASAVAWSGVGGKPSTVAGYGITDMGSQSVNYATNAGTVTNVTMGQVLAATALAQAGAVGSYAFARIAPHAAGDSSFGAIRSGGDLYPTSAASSVFSGGTLAFQLGGLLPGTWRCMGYGDYEVSAASGGQLLGATLWLRVV